MKKKLAKERITTEKVSKREELWQPYFIFEDKKRNFTCLFFLVNMFGIVDLF